MSPFWRPSGTSCNPCHLETGISQISFGALLFQSRGTSRNALERLLEMIRSLTIPSRAGSELESAAIFDGIMVFELGDPKLPTSALGRMEEIAAMRSAPILR